jgi:tryptophan-rich sensory protein
MINPFWKAFTVLSFTLTTAILNIHYGFEDFKESWSFTLPLALLTGLVGLGFWQIWRHRQFKRIKPSAFWFTALMLSGAAWPVLFFELGMPLLSLLDAMLFMAISVIVFRAFYQRNRRAGYMVVPLLFWAAVFTLQNYLNLLGPVAMVP